MIERLDDLAAAWSASLLRASWQGGLLIAAAWLLVRCRLGLPPRVACWIWRLADLKLIVALVWAAPLLLPLLPPLHEQGPIPEAFAPATGLPPSPAGGPRPIPSPAGEPAEPSGTPLPSVATAALLVWLFGVIGGVTRAARGWLAAGRLRRSCWPIERPDLREAASDLALVLGLRRVPELRAGPAVARPMLVGAFRPAILLPVAMLGDPRSIAALRPILAHELAHVRRGDLLWGAVAGLVRALFFFHPAVWLAHREALVAREAACDALALGASGVRPSEYGRILLEIAAGGPERLARWAAALGMAGAAGSLRRRLIAMKTTQPPSRRRLLSWANALLAVGAAGIIPWRLVPREAITQEPPPAAPAKEPARDGRGGRPAATAESAEDQLSHARARLLLYQIDQKYEEGRIAEAEAEARAATAQREYRSKQLNRVVELEKKGAVEHWLVDEEKARLREAQAAVRAAEARIAGSRAHQEYIRAAVRDAEALHDLARARQQGAPDDGDVVKAALAHLQETHLALARAHRELPRAEVDRAEARLKTADATVDYRTRQTERIRQLVERGAVERRLLDEQEQALGKARKAQRDAKADVEYTRTQLKSFEAKLKAAEAGVEGGAPGPGPESPPAAPRRP
jgi:beta-lactamase regulating signal transducer with metallopeptidase domain